MALLASVPPPDPAAMVGAGLLAVAEVTTANATGAGDGDLIGASRLHAVGDDGPCAVGGVDGRGVTSTP
jgi:hypothetical protein